MNHTFQHINPWTIDSGKEGPHLLIIAGVHGDEFEPILAIRDLIQFYQKGSIILNKGRLTLVDVVNRPAYERSSRTGVDEKDLARTCPGNEQGSETEQIAAEISHLISQADYLIDMHTGGRTFEIFPLAGYILHPNTPVLDQQRAMAQAFNLPIIWGTSPALEGRTLSVARDYQIPAIYTEYGGGSAIQIDIIHQLKEGCLRVLAYLQMTAPTIAPTNQVVYTVEDYRPQSGHLQIMYPAPTRGFFVPTIHLGDQVVEDQLLGYIYTEPGEIHSILAAEAGLVFLLRSECITKEGEAMLGILPITAEGNKTIYEE